MKKHNVFNACFSVPLFSKLLKRQETPRTSGTPSAYVSKAIIERNCVSMVFIA